VLCLVCVVSDMCCVWCVLCLICVVSGVCCVWCVWCVLCLICLVCLVCVVSNVSGVCVVSDVCGVCGVCVVSDVCGVCGVFGERGVMKRHFEKSVDGSVKLCNFSSCGECVLFLFIVMFGSVLVCVNNIKSQHSASAICRLNCFSCSRLFRNASFFQSNSSPLTRSLSSIIITAPFLSTQFNLNHCRKKIIYSSIKSVWHISILFP